MTNSFALGLIICMLSNMLSAQIAETGTTNLIENSLTNNSIGNRYIDIEFTQHISNKLFIKTGLMYSYEIRPENKYPFVDNVKLPLMVGIDFYESRNVNISPAMGLCFYPNVSGESSTNSTKRRLSLNCDLGFNYKISKNISIGL